MDASRESTRTDQLAAFRAQLAQSVTAAQEARARERAALDEAMRARTDKHRQFERVATSIIEAEVIPRVQMIAEQFPNATVERGRTAAGAHVRCRFASSARFPATVQFTVGVLLDADRGTATINFRLEVVPLLKPIDPAEHLDFPLDDAIAAPIVEWIEHRLFAFVRFYLGLETDASYQHADAGVDPVCGMALTSATAAERIVERAHTWYFCSATCRARFEADRAVYVGAHGEWRAAPPTDARSRPDPADAGARPE